MNFAPVWVNYLLLIVSGLVQLVGLFGLLLVFFPGLTIIWVGQLIWAIYTGFNQGHAAWQVNLTIVIFVLNTILMLAGSILDNFLMAGKAYQKGAPWWEIGLSLLAMLIVGLFLTPIGGLAAALSTLFLCEYYRLEKDKAKAWESTKSMALGWGWSTLLRFLIAVVMIVLWVVLLIFL